MEANRLIALGKPSRNYNNFLYNNTKIGNSINKRRSSLRPKHLTNKSTKTKEIIVRQDILKKMGYYDYLVDGKWGPKSSKAMRKFREELVGDMSREQISFENNSLKVKLTDEYKDDVTKRLIKKNKIAQK